MKQIILIEVSPTVIDPQPAAVGLAQLFQPMQEGSEASLSFRIIGGPALEYADATHPVALLSACGERLR